MVILSDNPYVDKCQLESKGVGAGHFSDYTFNAYVSKNIFIYFLIALHWRPL